MTEEEALSVSSFDEAQYRALNAPWRWALQQHLEVPVLADLLEGEGISLEGKRVVEVGCGAGYSTRLFMEHFRPAEMVGIDPLESHLFQARGQVPAGAVFKQGDAIATGEPDAGADAVFCLGLRHQVGEGWEDALEEFARILKPGGVLVVEEIHGALSWVKDWFFGGTQAISRGPGWRAWRKALERAGFEVLGEEAAPLGSARTFLARKKKK